MVNVRLNSRGYCPLTGKLKFKLEEDTAAAIKEILVVRRTQMYSYFCKEGCSQWHLTHLNPERYVVNAPVPALPVTRVISTFPLPAATVKSLVEYKKRLEGPRHGGN